MVFELPKMQINYGNKRWLFGFLILFSVALVHHLFDLKFPSDFQITYLERRKLINYIRGQHVYVKKDESSVKLIFLAGLMNTGHDQFSAIWDSCENCIIHEELSQVFNQMFIETASIPKYFNLKTKAMQLLASLQKKYEGQDVSIILNTGKSTPSMPYPSSLARDDYPKHPDLGRLAQMARHASLDLRIIVLVRDAQHVMKDLVAGNQRNQKINYGYTAREFVDLCEIQVSQLLDIDPRFYVCWDHNDPVNEDTLKLVGDHIGYKSNGGGGFVGIGRKMLADNEPSVTLSGAQLSMIDFYRVCVDNLRELCHEKPSSLSDYRI